MAVGVFGTPAAFAAETPSASSTVEPKASTYTCTSSHSGNTGSAKCVDLARLDRYRAKVTCIDSRGIQHTGYGPWKGGTSGQWSSYTCPGAGFFYKAGYQVELF
ncbi:hypothetical protein [Streptomyces sp. NRRL F-5650]|uniref:hypothetical protein n=1 Tax=Streptomyces sp. NRRL F-5650 TaxID=1463868 RepID=UPI00131B23DB|nr:hypothetical protein [Streptomyces sp. NRRL F-5650]